MNKALIIKIVKITTLSIVGAALLYFTYAIIAQVIIWNMQPTFTNGTITTSSMGFLVQTFICLGIWFILAAGAIVMSIFYYILPAAKRKKALAKAA